MSISLKVVSMAVSFFTETRRSLSFRRRLDMRSRLTSRDVSFCSKTGVTETVFGKLATASTSFFHQYTLVTKDLDRDELQKFLTTKNIPAMVYYPVPMHMQKAYQDPRYKEGDFPVTEKLSKSVISLPMHTEMDEEQLKFITSSILEFANR